MDLGELGALLAGDVDELLAGDDVDDQELELERHPTRPSRCPRTLTR